MKKNNNSNNISDNNSLLDAITLVGFLAQLKNIGDDNIQTTYIKKVIQAIADEIEKLHKENDIIIKQNEEILEILKKESINGA